MPLARMLLLRAMLILLLSISLYQFWLTYEMDSSIPALVAGVSAAFWLVALLMHWHIARWNRRFETQLCPACGYDLRETKDRCPECGHETTESEITMPKWLAGSALDLARAEAQSQCGQRLAEHGRR
jgi:hypothetical protein